MSCSLHSFLEVLSDVIDSPCTWLWLQFKVNFYLSKERRNCHFVHTWQEPRSWSNNCSFPSLEKRPIKYREGNFLNAPDFSFKKIRPVFRFWAEIVKYLTAQFLNTHTKKVKKISISIIFLGRKWVSDGCESSRIVWWSISNPYSFWSISTRKVLKISSWDFLTGKKITKLSIFSSSFLRHNNVTDINFQLLTKNSVLMI